MLPAIAEKDDQIGRQPGEALWPEKFPLERLERIKTNITITQGPREWTAQYQQRPTEEEGDLFLQEWFKYYPHEQPPDYLRIYMLSDFAVTHGGGNWTVHLVVGVDPEHKIYLLDLWRDQTHSGIWVERGLDLIEKWRPLYWVMEKGQIEKGVGPFLFQRSLERKIYFTEQLYASSADKRTRASSIQGRYFMGFVHHPKGAPWLPEFEAELLRFTGEGDEQDDQVDCLSLLGRMLNEMAAGEIPQEPDRPLVPDYTRGWKETEDERAKEHDVRKAVAVPWEGDLRLYGLPGAKG